MENFNEVEIQKKIEEKRKRFIENAHRALGFYDQNILTATEEHKKKRSDLMEQEFNKVFDEAGKSLRRYDEEPAKPLIFASSKNPENVVPQLKEEHTNKNIKDSSMTYTESRNHEIEDDSLVTAEKEMELKKQASMSTKLSNTLTSETKAATPVLMSKLSMEKAMNMEEEKKNARSYDETLARSQKKNKEKMKSVKLSQDGYYQEADSDNEHPRGKSYNSTAVAKAKKPKKFVVNTKHCRQERETLQYVIDLCRWNETNTLGDGNLIWYGVSLRDCDIDIIRARPKLYFNRYPGSELLARK